MQTTNITAYTEDTSQLDAIKAFMKALKIKFEVQKESPYDKNFVNKILQGDEEFKRGKSKAIKTADLWK
jgi:hypothetical protein